MKIFLSLLLVSATLALWAEELKAQGGFGGVHVASEFSPSGNMFLIGGGGAWVINSNFYLGGAGYGAVNTLATNSGELSTLGYGGLMVGYFKELKESVRIGGDVLTGSGGYAVDDREEGFYFIEPNIKVWYSIKAHVHLTAGVYYRIAYQNANAVLSKQDLSNFGIKLSLNFGKL